jgi:hypothetical protein
VNPGTSFWLVQPITSKSETAVAAAIRSLHGPKGDMSKIEIRSDNANELVNAIESSGSFSNPVTPYRPNSNKAERSILTFTDLLRVHFVKSGLSPCFRPLLAVCVAQLWNLFRNVKRTDVDGNVLFSTPYELRHGSKSTPINLDQCPMPGQLVTYGSFSFASLLKGEQGGVSSYRFCNNLAWPSGAIWVYWGLWGFELAMAPIRKIER